MPEQTLRPRAQIDSEYRQVSTLYGDRIFKIEQLKIQVEVFKNKMIELSQEKGCDDAQSIQDNLEAVVKELDAAHEAHPETEEVKLPEPAPISS